MAPIDPSLDDDSGAPTICGTAVWPVMVWDWEHQCCGRPFAIGDEVGWTLSLQTRPRTDMPPEVFVTAAVVPSSAGKADDGEPGARVLLNDSLIAWAHADQLKGLPETPQVITLSAESHGGVPPDLPVTRGRVARIRLVEQEYEVIDDTHWGPASPAVVHTDLPASLQTYGGGAENSGQTRTVRTGFLVDLEVTSLASPATRTSGT